MRSRERERDREVERERERSRDREVEREREIETRAHVNAFAHIESQTCKQASCFFLCVRPPPLFSPLSLLFAAVVLLS